MSNLDHSYGLALVQQDIVYDQLHRLASPLYNIGGYVSLQRVDVARLRQAHAQVVTENRMFAARLVAVDGGLRLQLGGLVDTTLDLVDLSGEVDPQMAAKTWLDGAFAQPFDLYGDCLFRAHLLKLNDDSYFYVGIAHHVIVDGWGFANWARQLGNHYAGDAPEPEALADFARYFSQDMDYLHSERYSRDQAFWKSYLPEPKPLLAQARSQAFAPTERCSQRLCVDLDHSLLDRLLAADERLAKNEHSLFVALVALYFSRVCQRSSVSLGVPAHNRRGAAHKRFVGLFTSVSPVQIAVDESWTFMQLVEAVKAEQAKVFRHQKYPVGHMVRDLGPAARAGLYDVGVNYLKLDNRFDYGDFTAHIVYHPNDYQNTPFNLTVWDSGASQPAQLQIDFSLQYFTVHEVELIGARLLHLVAQLASDPQQSLAGLDVVAPCEAATVFPPIPNLPTAPNHTFIALFEQQVAIRPDALALSWRDREYTYKQLDQLASKLALRLASQHICNGDLVGLLLGRRPPLVIAILALHKLGAAYLPLDPAYPPARLEFMLADSGASLLLQDDDLETADLVAGYTGPRLSLGDDWLELPCGSFPPAFPSWACASQLAYVLYTSGSTGQPKGVMIGQRALSNFLQSMAQQPGLKEGDWLLAVTPFSFDISMLELLLPLMTGGTLRLFHRALAQDPAGLLDELNTHPIRLLQMTPSAWKLLLAAGWQGSKNLVALAGGEALPAHLAETLVPKVDQLWNMYGPTETTIWSSCRQVSLPATASIGTPIANTRFQVLDNQRRPLPVGVFGSLYIGGVGLAKGYLKRPELTAERFVTINGWRETGNGERWYETGDMARLLPNGEFEFQGRADHQVKLNGYRIELGEIESKLARVPGIANCAVLIKTLNDRQLLAAYYQLAAQAQPAAGAVLATDHSSEEARIRAALAEELPVFMLPSAFVAMEKFPLTPSGKTDIKALPEPVQPSAIPETKTTSGAGDDFTQRLLQLSRQWLRLPKLAASDNFFDAGASSLDVTDLAGGLSRDLALNLSVIDLFSHPSVAALARHLQAPAQPARSSTARQQAAERGKTRLQNRLTARKLLDEA